MVKLNTYIGKLEVTSVWKDSLGYHARTGKDYSTRTWSLTEQEYKELKKELDES